MDRSLRLLLLAAMLTFTEGSPAAGPAPAHAAAETTSSAAAKALEPVRRSVVLRDLLEGQTPPVHLGGFNPAAVALAADRVAETEKAKAAKQRNRTSGPRRISRMIETGEKLVLELAGEVLLGPEWTPGDKFPEFVVYLDGKVVFRKSVEPAGSTINFSHSIPLDRYEGKSINVLLQVDEKKIDHLVAWWTKAWVVRFEAIPRLDLAGGRNVLLVVVDTLRADHLGTYGYNPYEQKVSPYIDKYATQGLVFEQAIAPSSWTQPSVATILTGLSEMQHGVIGGVALNPFIETLGESFQDAGYTTIAISANPIVGEREGFDRGFESFDHRPWNPAGFVNRAFAQWLFRNRTKRWFAYIHFIDPHDPYDAPDEYTARFTRAYDGSFRDPGRMDVLLDLNLGKSTEILTDADVDFLRGSYDAEIGYLDLEFNKLMGVLRRAQVYDNTVVVFTADHGEEFRDHGKYGHGWQLYDESVRVPLIVWAPGFVEPGRRKSPIDLAEVKPIVERLAGIGAAGPELEGVLFKGDEHEFAAYSQVTRLTSSPSGNYERLASLRRDGWKFIRNATRGTSELYDLRRDPGERENLVAAEPERAARYAVELEAWIKRGEAQQSRSETDPGLIDRLRSLGYVR